MLMSLLLIYCILCGCSADNDESLVTCNEQPVDVTFCDCENWTFENTPNAAIEEIEYEFVHEYLNPYRVSFGLMPVTINDTLSLVAQRHANDMATRDYFNHTTLDCEWGPIQRGRFANIRLNGENIAAGQRTAEIVFEGWRNSEGHNRNMKSNHKQTGIGLAYNSDGRPYWVNVFSQHE